MKAYDNTSLPIIRILIVDDHYLLRNGLRSMLLSLRDEVRFEVTDTDSGEKALQKLTQLEFDFAIVDYKLEGLSGPETIRRILRFKPDIKILGLSYFSDYACVESMMEAGASGYVLKSVQPSQLLTAIQTILAGKKYYCNEVALVLIAASEDGGIAKTLATYHITSRELEVLLLISHGMNNAAIAEQLCLSRRTIDTHRQNLLVKLKVNNTAALIRRALELQLLQ